MEPRRAPCYRRAGSIIPEKENGERMEEISRERRGKRMLFATMSGEGFKEQKITVRDISRQGIGARTSGTVPSAGQRVTLCLSQGRELTGTVRWSRQDRFGVHLDTNIDPAAFTGAGGSWEVARRPFAPDHVYDQFKPVKRAYRPGLKVK